MSVSDRSEEFMLEPESDEDFGLSEGLVDSDIAKSIANILADIVTPNAQVLPNMDGEIDIRATSTAMDIVFADVGGVIFNSGDLADPFGSGTGQYGPFLSLRDSNQMPLDSDGVATGFNVGSTSDPLLNDLIFANSRTNAVALSNLVIITVEGEEFFEIRLDLNEPDSGTNSQLQITDLTMYFGDGSIDSYVDLAGATQVWDLDDDSGEDVTLLLNDNFSGSGTDDYQILIPVSLFNDAGADFSSDFFFLEVTAGSDDPASEFAMEGGFFEFNIQEGGSVSGIKFLDSNNNGVLDGGEGAPADSFIIYVDANEDGQLNFTDDGDGILEFNGDDIILERYTETAPDGSYEITGLEVGTYQIREYLPSDSLYEGPTTGAFETVTVVVDTNTVVDPIGNFLPDPQIDITKEVTAVDGSAIDLVVDEAGDVIDYRITVTTGLGNVALTNVVVTDPLLSGMPLEGVDDDMDGFNDGDLDEDNILDLNESWIYDGSYTATQGDINDNGGGNGLIDNTATATSDEAGPVDASATVPIDRNPQIDITKEVTAVDGSMDPMNFIVDEAGDVIEYQISVTTADGNVDLTNVVVNDPLLSGMPLVLVSGDDGDGILELDETWVYEGSYTATQDDINDNGGGNGLIDNTATAISDQVGPVDASATVPIDRNPLIDITKEVTAVDGSMDPMNFIVDEAGDVIDYRITVTTGMGNVELTNVVVTDPLLSGMPLEGVDDDMDGFNDGDLDEDNVLDLNESWIYDGSYTATQGDINDNGGGNGLIDNTATATSDQAGPVNASATVPIDRNPQIDIAKEVTAVDGSAIDLVVDEAGDVIDYRITVTTGMGNVELTNVVVTDPLLSGLPLEGVDDDMDGFNDGDLDEDNVLDLNESWIYDGSYTATQGDINDNGGGNGLIDNTATATSDQAGPANASATVPIERNPQIDIIKEVTAVAGDELDLEVNAVGEVIDYRISVTAGLGNVSLSNVIVDDPLLADLSFISGDTNTNSLLDPGETWIYEGSYEVLQSDIDDNGGGDGDIDNTATATSDQAGPVEASAEVPLFIPDPSIDIVKDGTLNTGGDGIANVGDTIDYTLVVTNDGNVTLDNVVVTDPDADPMSIVRGADLIGNNDDLLEVGEEWSYTATHTLTQAEIDSGEFTNIADVDATDPSDTPVNDDDPHTEVLPPLPVIDIVKDGTLNTGGDGIANVGDTIDYTLVVTNDGNVTLDNVVVTDPDADPMSIVRGADIIGNNDDLLEVGEEWSYTATHTLTQAEIDSGEFTNIADVDATDPNDTPVNDDDPHTEVLPAVPVIDIVKDGTLNTGGDGIANVGDTIDYTLVVTNDGNVTLDNVVVTDPDADPMSIVRGADIIGNNDDLLEVGEEWSYTATHTLTQAEIDAGEFTNVADVDATDPNDTPVNDEDPHTEQLPAVPVIDIIKDGTLNTGGDGIANVGDTIDYTLVVTNDGNVTLDNVVVTDPDADPMSIVRGADIIGNNDDLLEVGEEWSYTATHTLTQAEIDSGEFTNVADVDATDPNDTPVNDEDPHTEVLQAVPVIDIVKDGTLNTGGDGIANVGDTIDYTLVVTNDGNVTLDNVVVTDPDADMGSIVRGADIIGNNDDLLEVGEEWSYTATHTLTQAEIDAGEFTNIADVDATDPSDTPVNDDDPHTEQLPAVPVIDIIKDGTLNTGGDGIANVGDTIDYTLVVTNDGNVTLDNVVVTDPDADPMSIVRGADIIGNNDDLLEVGEEWSYTATHTLTQAEIDSGEFTNVADVDATDPNDTPVNDEDPHTEVLQAVPVIDIVKDGTLNTGGDGIANVGDTIDYTLFVTNDGNVTLDNVVVTDPDADMGSIVRGADIIGNNDDLLEVGEEWSYTATHTLTQAEIDSGEFTNIADVDATDPNDTPVNDDDPHTEILPAVPVIDIVKDGTLNTGGDGIANVGDTIDYTLVVTNDGNVTLDNVVVTDPDADPMSIARGADIIGNNDDLLEVGEEWSYTATHTLTQAEIDSGEFTNIADVDATDPNDTPVNDDDPHTEILPAVPVIDIVKDGEFADENMDGFADVGETIQYTLMVSNDGNVSLTDIVVTDPDADPGTILAVEAGGFNVGDADTDGELDVDETWSYTAQHTITQAEIDEGSFTNIATVCADDPTSDDVMDLVCDDDDHEEELPRNPVIEIIKDGEFADENMDGFADVGETIQYTLAVSNIGNVTLDEIVVTDPDADPGTIVAVEAGGFNVGDADMDGELDVNETWSYTAQHTITQAEIDEGSFTNIATVCADDPTSDDVMDLICDDDDHEEELPRNPVIDIVKDGAFADENADTYANVGETIQYTLAVSNIGNVTLDDIVVTDPDADPGSIAEVLAGGFNVGDADMDGMLDVDETWQYTAVHTITQEDIDAGSFTNIATVCADDPTSDNVLDLICDEDDHTEELPSPPEGWFGTPGFWKNHCEFFDGILDNEPKQAGQEYFPEGEMTIVVADDAPFYAGETGVWLNFNDDDVVDEGEFWSTDWLKDALDGGKGNKGPKNAVDILERDLAALVLNIAASPDAGSDNNPDTVDPIQLIQWAQEWLDAYGDGMVRTNSGDWKAPQFDGAPSASDLHNFIDQLNNTGSFDGNEDFPGGTFGEDRDQEDEELIEEAVETSTASDFYIPGELYTIKYSAPEGETATGTKDGSTVSKDANSVTIEDYFALMADTEFVSVAQIASPSEAIPSAPQYSPSELFAINYTAPLNDGVAESKFADPVEFLSTLEDAYSVHALADEEHLFYDANDLVDVA